jgi:hypothetical protein
MSDSVLTVVRPGQSISDAVKQDLQQTAQAKQIVEMKKQGTAKLSLVINSLMQTFALDPDHACSTALAYAVGMAQGTATSKEDFLKSVEKIWTLQLAQQEEVKEEQRKMLLNVAKQVMAQKKPINANLLGQMQAIGCVIPADIQEYIDAQVKPAEVAPGPTATDAKN